MMDSFKRRDIVQLICDTAWNKKGELAIVDHVGFDSLDVAYENEAGLCLVPKRCFRKVYIDELYKKVRH